MTALSRLLSAAARSRRALLALDAALLTLGIMLGAVLAKALLIHADLFAMPLGVAWGMAFALRLLTDPSTAPLPAWIAWGAMAAMAGKYALPPGRVAIVLSSATAALPIAGALLFAIVAAGS